LHETVEIENVRRDGDRAWVSWTIKGLRNGDGRITEIQCVGNDITRLKQAEDALKRSEQRFKELYGQSERAARLHKALLDYSPDPIAVYDIEGRAIYINSAFTKMFGWRLDEVSGKKIDFVPEESEKETEEMIKQALEGREFSDLTTKRLTKDGDIIDVSISGALYGDELGNPSGGIVHFRDIREKKRAQAALKKAHDELDQRVKERTEELAQTNARLQEEIRERQRIEEALRYQASHDYLTGLWNRKTTMEALERELSRCERENADAGVVMIDVDHFKDVNDSAGHLAGDFVLKQVADRIKDQLRVYDWLGRYGGEEFLIILPGANKAQAVNVSERIRRTIAQTPIQIDGGVVSVTISLGVTTVREMEQIKVDTAIRNADTALYLAKENGRNRVEFYDSSAALQ
jgi:diguanylate cyclase (GGDEF)-like protein/PAS domain S-box-containing protein